MRRYLSFHSHSNADLDGFGAAYLARVNLLTGEGIVVSPHDVDLTFVRSTRSCGFAACCCKREGDVAASVLQCVVESLAIRVCGSGG